MYSFVGLDAAEKKYGGSWGQDTEKHRAMNEKIVCPPTKPYLFPLNHNTNNFATQTDTARDKFESMTGKDVPDKISN